MSDEAIRVKNLHVTYGAQDVIEDVSLVASHGECLALLGPNGAGKTTLLKALAGIVPHRGRIDFPSNGLAVERSAYVPQQSLLDTPFTVEDVVAQGQFVLRQNKCFNAAKSRNIVEGSSA
ncbi:MAG: ATP-binding cassette domain-containing protein [Polyangiales bacterium]